MTSAKDAVLSFVVRYVLVILLLLVGAFIFKELENVGIEREQKDIDHAGIGISAKKEMLRKDFSAALNITINATVFDALISDAQQLAAKDKPNSWDLATGTHFAFTIMSTIGYGVIVPTNDNSKVFSMIYAVVSIPLFLYALAAAGEVKKMTIDKILYLVEIRALKRSQINRKHQKVLLFTVVLFFVEMLLASTVVQQLVSEWSYLDSFYYWFITVSTIGFGDYVLSYEGNNKSSTVYLFCVIIVNLILQSGLATIFSTITDMLTEKAQSRGRFCLKRNKNEESVVQTETQLQPATDSKY